MSEKNYEECVEVETVQKAKVLTRMYTLLLCDDDTVFLEDLRQHVHSIFSQGDDRVRIHCFSGMEDISDPILEQCDIAILDIDFAGKRYNGIDIAKRLRTRRSDSVIIFLTNYIEYAPEGYEVRAFRYLMKNEMAQKIERYLNQARAYLSSECETIRFQISGEIISIPITSNKHPLHRVAIT